MDATFPLAAVVLLRAIRVMTTTLAYLRRHVGDSIEACEIPEVLMVGIRIVYTPRRDLVSRVQSVGKELVVTSIRLQGSEQVESRGKGGLGRRKRGCRRDVDSNITIVCWLQSLRWGQVEMVLVDDLFWNL